MKVKCISWEKTACTNLVPDYMYNTVKQLKIWYIHMTNNFQHYRLSLANTMLGPSFTLKLLIAYFQYTQALYNTHPHGLSPITYHPFLLPYLHKSTQTKWRYFGLLFFFKTTHQSFSSDTNPWHKLITSYYKPFAFLGENAEIVLFIFALATIMT